MPPDDPVGNAQPAAPITAAMEPALVPRYCEQCGAALGEDGVCGACLARANSPAEARTAAASPIRVPLLLYFGLLAVSIVSIGVVLASRHLSERDAAQIEITATVAQTAIVLVFAVFNLGTVKRELTAAPSRGWMLAAAGFALATYGLSWLYIRALQGLGMDVAEYSPGLLEAGWSWWGVFALIALQPAVIEELAFRGVVFSALRRALGPWETVVVSAFMFATLHLMPVALPVHLGIGLVLGWVRLKSGSLYPCMALHGIHNGLVILAEMMGHA